MRLPLPLIAAVGSLTLALAAATTLALTDTYSVQAQPQPQSPLVQVVDMNEFAIYPQQYVFKANQPVRFVVTNSGAEDHRFVVRGMGMAEDVARSDRALPGATLTVDATFTTPGGYLVLCTVGDHREDGMVGTLTVVAPTAEAVLEVPVQMGEYFYNPVLVSTIAGQPTRFQLSAGGDVNHLFVIRGHGIDARSPTVRPGEPVAWDITLAEPGTYEIYCPFTLGGLHSDLGMIGTLQVLPGGGGGGM
jgi:uncharacterized cupredoxin-like copper-binding protein